MSKLDEILTLLDPEEMIRDGIKYFKFRHEDKNKSVILDVSEIKQIKKERKL